MKRDLENRMIDFAVSIVEIAESLPASKSATHLAGQLVRSGTSSALNYGEAQSGESRNDFIHKMKIVVKELRETYICLQIIQRTGMTQADTRIDIVLKENNELISIFVQSIKTAKANNERKKLNSLR